MATAFRWLGVTTLASVAGCGGVSVGGPIVPQEDPTPLAKCTVAAKATNPLVTEWPASEKAHLQSLADARTVAVSFTGCELQIIDGCVLPGRYAWHRTTLATDTVEIANADELFAKLPLGAFSLEGELERRGRLAVKTTVAGQLRAEEQIAEAPESPACAEATHYVSAVSVGTFKLLSGSKVAGGGRAGVLGVEAGAAGASKEVVLREAGVPESCLETTDEAPHTDCASPIQVFLQPLPGAPGPSPAASDPSSREYDPQARGAINIAFPAPEDDEEQWTLRTARSDVVCILPCDAWVEPVSGYFLRREDPREDLRLPESFPHKPGAHVRAEYELERGEPFLSAFMFYGLGIPAGIMGLILIPWGIADAASGCEDDMDAENKCRLPLGLYFGYGGSMLALSGLSTWWFVWSHDEEFTTHEEISAGSTTRARLLVGPGFVAGTF